MFKFLKEKKKDNKGFTLVELVIVIAILAILVGLLAPQYTKYVEKSRKSADVSNMDEMVKAVQVWAVDRETTKDTTDIDGVTIALTKTNVTISNDTVKAGIKEYVPDVENIKVKSTQWTANPTATIKITKDGGVSVSYSPDDFAEYAERNKTAPTTPNPKPAEGNKESN